MSRFIGPRLCRGAELLLAASMLLFPSRFHWSRDSRGVLAAAGLALVGAGSVPDRTDHHLNMTLSFLSRNRMVIAGATLFGVQYLLTEEEGAVRGRIAGLGGVLVTLGLIGRRLSASGNQVRE